jgi:diadenosine tetraphosphate (Ap4A) HIT family hydrolase
MNGCYFCDRMAGRVEVVGGAIYADDLAFAFHETGDEWPAYLGDLVVVPRRHTGGGLAELTDAEAQALGLLVVRLSRALQVCAGAERAYAECYGEVTPHVHIFVPARYPGAPPEYWRGNVRNWPAAPRGDVAQVAALCERLRTQLSRGA